MNDLKTPVARLARLFRDARDRWKSKALERQRRLRAAQVRIRDLERSRAYWKARALAAGDQTPANGTSGGETEAASGDEPPMAMVPTRVANHHHCLEVIALSLQLYLHASFGCRGVSWVLRLLTGYLPLGVPASTTVLNWCYRLGLAVLLRPLPRRDDWIFVIDHTVALGAQKCLVVLGIPASRLAETGYSPRHCDMTVLAVEVTAKSTGIGVAAVLEQVSTRAGVPVQIVSDHGSDVRKGIALFRQQAPGCVETYDISHAIATYLKAHWRDDVHWQGFLKQAAATLSHFQQTELLFLLPPRQRTKARYMHVDAHLQWAQRLIGYHDQGDFSAIGRPCVFSANAWAHLRAKLGKRRVEPLRALIGQRYDTRAALCEALRAQGATMVDGLDDAFWRLADRGYARFLEAFAWVLAYREVLSAWTQTIAVSKTVQTVLKTRGLSHATPAVVQAELSALGALAAPVADFQARILQHVEHEAAKLPAAAIWLASSDIMALIIDWSTVAKPPQGRGTAASPGGAVVAPVERARACVQAPARTKMGGAERRSARQPWWRRAA
ncbi:hypothetical protein Thi970DRAFT_00392 [Thiorhodovibrio frisius]|uniref:Uncharacterized protein n=1 Tax=Thiorhodovibrio frisius TaxID=631362 RepID=H8YWD4_9GAMM|nr:hypothetical protein [Thiorhodovibrio frisius]EIC23678.1 hypothetical protein Thi970DRAFT_00392 [Thiorhodovibrio frisius]WPL20138.1 hypothetical protein Thiofri_00198 [Thiorhodovibrio frisius]